jgi:hypothetical protein
MSARALSFPRTLTDRREEIITTKAKASVAGFAPREIVMTNPRTLELAIDTKAGEFRIQLSVMSSPDSGWLMPTILRASELLALPRDWNHQGAPKVDPLVLQDAINTLGSFMQNESPLPQWTPTREGGAQVDWHERGIDLEVAFAPNGQSEVVFVDHERQLADFDGSVSETLDQLRRVFSERLTKL